MTFWKYAIQMNNNPICKYRSRLEGIVKDETCQNGQKFKDQTSNGIFPLPFSCLWTEILGKTVEIHFWFNTIWNIPRLKLRSKKDLENHWRCWQKYWKLQILEKIYATFFMQMAFFAYFWHCHARYQIVKELKIQFSFSPKVSKNDHYHWIH